MLVSLELRAAASRLAARAIERHRTVLRDPLIARASTEFAMATGQAFIGFGIGRHARPLAQGARGLRSGRYQIRPSRIASGTFYSLVDLLTVTRGYQKSVPSEGTFTRGFEHWICGGDDFMRSQIRSIDRTSAKLEKGRVRALAKLKGVGRFRNQRTGSRGAVR